MSFPAKCSAERMLHLCCLTAAMRKGVLPRLVPSCPVLPRLAPPDPSNYITPLRHCHTPTWSYPLSEAPQTVKVPLSTPQPGQWRGKVGQVLSVPLSPLPRHIFSLPVLSLAPPSKPTQTTPRPSTYSRLPRDTTNRKPHKVHCLEFPPWTGGS